MITIDEIKEKYRAGTCHQVCDIKTCGERIEIANLAIQLDSENTKLKAEIATLKRQLNNSTAYGS